MADTRFYIGRWLRPEEMAKREPRKEHIYHESGPCKNQLKWDPETRDFATETIEPTKNPFMGVCGLPIGFRDPGSMYIGNKFCMPLCGGGKDIVEPFEYDSFEQAATDIASGHQLGIAFDFPVPTHAVLWRVTLYSHYDGSRRTVCDNAKWRQARLYWLAALGLNSAVKCYLDVQIHTKLGRDTSIAMPCGYSFFDCREYQHIKPRDLLDKPGHIDRFEL